LIFGNKYDIELSGVSSISLRFCVSEFGRIQFLFFVVLFALMQKERKRSRAIQTCLSGSQVLPPALKKKRQIRGSSGLPSKRKRLPRSGCFFFIHPTAGRWIAQAHARVSHSRNCFIGYNKDHVDIDFDCRWDIELSFIFPDDLV